jgi:hypothetical protein
MWIVFLGGALTAAHQFELFIPQSCHNAGNYVKSATVCCAGSPQIVVTAKPTRQP